MGKILAKIGLVVTGAILVIVPLGIETPKLSGTVDGYVVTDLGAFSNRSIAYSIRGGGPLEVVGSSGTYPEDETAFIYTGGNLQKLPMRQARGINSLGQVVGSSGLGGEHHGPVHSFRYRAGLLEDLGTLPGGENSSGNGINNNGDVAGSASTADGAIHATLYRQGLQDLGTFGGKDSFASGVNDRGEVVGQAQTASGARHAFRYSNGVMEDLGTLGGRESFALRINNGGIVIGYASNSQGFDRAFIKQTGPLIDLGTLGGSRSEGHGLNNNGAAVGLAQTAAGANHAFIYSAGIMSDLNNLISADSGWVLSIANDISDDGRIVGAGVHNGQRRAFLLTPR